MAKQGEKKKVAILKSPAKNTGASVKKQSPEKSGKVKGPMGVGGARKPDSQKISSRSLGGSHPNRSKISNFGKEVQVEEDQPEIQASGHSKSPKNLPERTRDIEEHLTLIPGDEKISKKKSYEAVSPMHEKDNAPIILGTSVDVDSQTESIENNNTLKDKVSEKKQPVVKMMNEKVDAEVVKEKIRTRKTQNSDSENTSHHAKKMARRKSVAGISAEEKAKLPDTTFAEDLKSTAKESLRDLTDSLTPDQETQEELKELVKNVLPTQKEFKKVTDKLKDKLPKDI